MIISSCIGFFMFATFFTLNSKKKIIILMILEFLMMWTILLSLLIVKNTMSYNLSFVLVMICAMVTESILGLSIITCFSRNSCTNSAQMVWF